MLKRFTAVILITGACAAGANDFPTQARVEYVLSCMNAAGRQSYDTLFPCVCEVDRIAAVLSYKQYTEAETLSYLYSTPGERGGIFRDAITDARKKVKDLERLREGATAACKVTNIKAPGSK